MTWRVEAGLRSARGPGKAENEDTAAVAGLLLRADPGDAVTVAPPPGTNVVVLVADGMGGHAAGRVASRLAAEALVADERMFDGSAGIRDAVDAAHDALYAAMHADGGLGGMGSTVVGICIPPAGPARVFNVGDSRLFLRDEEVGVVQLSVDDAARAGTGTAPTLTQCLGGTTERVRIAPHDSLVDLCDGDRLLLCSDGLSDVLGSEVIAAELGSGRPPAEVATGLVARAQGAGARDDVTAVVVDVSEVRA